MSETSRPETESPSRRWAAWLLAAAGVVSLLASSSTLAQTWMYPIARSWRRGDPLVFDRARRTLPKTDVTGWWAPEGYPYGLDHLGIPMVVFGALALIALPLLVTPVVAAPIRRVLGPVVAGALFLTAATSIYLILRFREFWIDRIADGGGFRLGPGFWMISATAVLTVVVLGLYIGPVTAFIRPRAHRHK
ncbi:hypothetical protein [Nocardia sp. XZ_19_385]|uniref:hypothetical protein n=1 Tax=Nocardia sp. XZ_19_385 TaxID=2769488 RepID=UPI00188F9D5F|nr:hypothetical protein [Nocardia sp. XZ_19_385]